MDLFDCHVHLGQTDSGELYYGHLRGEEYLDLMKDAGVSQALVFPPYLRQGYRDANLELAQFCEGQAGLRAMARVGGKGVVLPEYQSWLVRKNIRRLILPKPVDVNEDELDKFAGIKLLPLMDGMPSGRFFDAANSRNLPFLIHGGKFTNAGWIAKNVLPKVQGNLVIAHLGAFPGIPDLIAEAINLAKNEPRVYLDTSGIWRTDLVKEAIEAVPEKIMFGSDCPLTHPRAAWEAVQAVVPDTGLQRRIGYELAAEVFGV